ncbi:MAG TPA: ATP-binding cassette domain-containing protein [Nitrososphaerales archaeon]|nr:ATP-binding cassette domain-containing protein [Nitrososphaerales archaeon]
MSKVIEARGLTKVYPPSTKAVDGVSFTVDEGEIFGFLGPNGAGKTTTIKMLTTLASISEGSCEVAGYDVKTKQGEVRMCIGLVPQDAATDGDLTGMENLILSAKLYKVPDAIASRRANELLDLVGLKDSANRLARTYSGGMKKRLELITGLIHEPRILFLDEPTLGLDIQTRVAMWDYINGINRDSKVTIFLTTHYLEEADSLCRRVAIIDHGQIKALDSPSTLKASLGGDLLEIQLPEGPDISAKLSLMEGVCEVRRRGNVYSLRTANIEKSLQAISVGLWKLGLKMEDARLVRPSLDQVFLNVTGRSIRDSMVDSGDVVVARARAESARN